LLGVTVPQNGSAMVQNKIHKKHRQSDSTCFSLLNHFVQ
jgi:hypothetical protein